MTKNTGGPAFPVIESERCESVCEGMTLRDHFAGLAMQEIIKTLGRNYKEELAMEAYKVADAMLAEREKGDG